MGNGGRVCILLGAGASVAAGGPSTVEITKRVLSGESIVHHTDGTYYLGNPNPDIPDGFTPRAVAVVRWVYSYLERYFFPYGRDANYEDIYYVLDQVCQSESWEYENPAIAPLADLLFGAMSSLRTVRERESRVKWDNDDLVVEASRYVKDVVWRLLQRVPGNLDGLSSIADACRQEWCRGVDVVTLNHDVALETHLTDCAITYSDGFGEPLNGIRYWSPDSLEDKAEVRILKLHGSVNWFYFLSPNQGLSVGIPEDSDVWYTRDSAGEMQTPTEGRPEFLCGTFNKILSYQNPIYADMHFQFFNALEHTSRMLVVGYSFGDKAVNRRIWDWMRTDERRMVVVHPNPNALIEYARPAIKDGLTRWKAAGRTDVIRKGLQDCSWSELRATLQLDVSGS